MKVKGAKSISNIMSFPSGLELETPSLVPVKKNASAVVVSDKYNLKPVPLKCQHNTQCHQRDLSEDNPATANGKPGLSGCAQFIFCSRHQNQEEGAVTHSCQVKPI